MKYRILIIVAFLVCGARATYIEWGGVRHGGFCLIDDSYFAYGSGLVCKDMTGWDLFEATIGVIQGTHVGGNYSLTFYNDLNYVQQNWLLAEKGDVIRYDTTRNLGEGGYLVAYGIDNDNHVGPTEIVVQPDTAMYLAFVCQEAASTTGYIYGWVELEIDSNGNLNVVDSAYDLDGGPMVVGGGAWTGGIPEPSGGMLFLLGVVALGLRRKTAKDCEEFGQ